jgi:hypothetical protein
MTDVATPFSWNVICQVCRKKVKASEIKKRWDGLLVCDEDFEHRHPNDFPLPAFKEQAPIPFSSPDLTTAQETDTPICSAIGQSGFVGRGIVGCMIVGGDDLGGFDMAVPTGSFNTSTL